MIAKDVGIMYDGTHAEVSSLTGWSRITDLDSRFIKGAATSADPNDTGGASTHTHTSPSHNHTLNAHTHTYVLDDCFAATDTSDGSGLIACEHYHTGTSGAASGGTTSSDAVTYGAVSNNPPYYDVIFIKPNGNRPLPAKGMMFYNTVTAPNGLTFCDGGSSTPDLRGKFIRGAAASGNAGGTGGSTTNTHDISHSHTAQAHTHVSATSSSATGHCERDGGAGSDGLADHTHSVSLGNGTAPIDSYSGSLVTTETVEPGYTKLMVGRNMTGGNVDPVGAIGIWLQPLALIPPGWQLVATMEGEYVKVANSSGEIGDSGGSNTHTHGSQSHSHSSTGTHTHSGGTISSHSGTRQSGVGPSVFDQATDNHAFSSISSNSATYASGSTTADSSNNEPEHRTVAFIKYLYDASGQQTGVLF